MAFHEVILSDYTSHPMAVSIIGLAQYRTCPTLVLPEVGPAPATRSTLSPRATRRLYLP